MSVSKDVFGRRETNYDFQSAGAPPTGWAGAARLPEALVPTHCCFCGVQCGLHLRVAGGRVTGVEPRDFPHNQGHLCPKGIVAYQQVHHPERLRYPLVRRDREEDRRRIVTEAVDVGVRLAVGVGHHDIDVAG